MRLSCPLSVSSMDIIWLLEKSGVQLRLEKGSLGLIIHLDLDSGGFENTVLTRNKLPDTAAIFGKCDNEIETFACVCVT